MLSGLRRVRDDGLHHRITRRSDKSPINKYVQSPRLFVDVHIPGVKTQVLTSRSFDPTHLLLLVFGTAHFAPARTAPSARAEHPNIFSF